MKGTHPHGDRLRPLWDLWSERYVDGMRQRLANALRRNWRGHGFPSDFIDECVCDALVDTADALLAGRRIANLRAYVLKAADRKLCKQLSHDRALRNSRGHVATQVHAPSALEPLAVAGTHLEDTAVAHALAVARQLLPEVGTGRVIDVLEVFLEAVENGVPNLPARTVADTLGITPSEVRSLLHRGLGRLRRAAARTDLPLPAPLQQDPFDHYDNPIDRLFADLSKEEPHE